MKAYTFFLVFVMSLWTISTALELGANEKKTWSIIDQEEADNILRDGFKNAGSTLEHIKVRLENVDVNLGGLSMRNDFREHVEMIESLTDSLKQYVIDPNRIRHDLFQKACGNYPMLNTISWIRRQMTRNNYFASLIDNLAALHNRDEFLPWSNFVALTFIKTSILGDVCLEAVYSKDRVLYETRERFRNDTKWGLRQIIDILKVTDLSIQSRTNWNDELQPYVRGYTKDNQNMSHGEFVEGLYDYLVDKYFWRNWLVIAYDGNLRYIPLYAEADGVYFPGTEYSRNVIVMSMEKGKRIISTKETDKCFSKYWSQPRKCKDSCSCYHFMKIIGECYDSVYFQGLFCLQRGTTVAMKAHPATFKFRPIQLYEDDNGFTTKKLPNAISDIYYDNYLFGGGPSIDGSNFVGRFD